jgi:RNA polymerase sigma factor (sigma-70 family)
MIIDSLISREATTDMELVGRTLDGDTDAFEHIVSRYQSLICSLAYSATGRLGQSQDLAQETFITAWKHLRLLHERDKLRAWLCGIARRIIGKALRRDGREPVHAAEPLEVLEEAAASQPLPSEHVITKEEEAILWRSLGRIPEIYREPLVLFYREHQSVETVAAALDLSEDTVRQRLSRGRRLLQQEVLAFIEGALERTNPGKAFTFGVLASLPVLTSSATAASVGVMVAAKAGATTKVGTGLLALNALAGPLMGFLSGYLGYKMSMDGAASEKERGFIKRFYVLLTIFIVAPLLVLLLAVAGKSLAMSHPRWFTGVLLGAVNSWIPATGLLMIWMRRRLRELNGSAGVQAEVRPRTTFEYRSRASLFGLPLIHIRMGATWSSPGDAVKAWIAIADDLAIGALFAFGGTAVAPICFGGFALGGVVFGGFAAGVLCYGGFGIGAWVVGGMVSGIMAVGGCAFGWNAALGGIAIAQQFASGGVALAAHANDAAANTFIKGNLFFQNAFLLVTKWLWPTLLVSMAPTLLIWRAAKKKRRQQANLPLLIIASTVATFAHACQSTALAQTADSPRPRSFSVQVVGHGTPMILIPGLSCGGDVWKTTVEHFKHGYECHVLTLAGFAGQPAIPAPMLETVRNDLAAYIRQKRLSHPVIVGHSLGGFLSFWLGATEAELVGPLVSVDGGTFFSALMDPRATAQTAKAAAETTRKMMEGQTAEQFAGNNRMFLAGMITDPTNVDLIAPTCAKSEPQAVALAMYELMTTDLREDAARIKSPVLLIGSGAFAASAEMKRNVLARYEEQVAKVPIHKVLIAEKARHFIMLDDPAFLFSAIEAFLGIPKAK